MLSVLPLSMVRADDKEIDDSQTWPALAVKKIMAKPLGEKEVFCWHLDNNSFAVKSANCLLIFDYLNTEPEPDKVYANFIPKKKVVRSLLTGVVNPDEIKNLHVIMFYSHEHPAETLQEALSWKDKVLSLTCVMPEEVYEVYKPKLVELIGYKKIGLSETDLENIIKIVKPNKIYNIRGQNVAAIIPHYFFDDAITQRYPGVEFVVYTRSGITLYHSGALLCPDCNGPTTVESYQQESSGFTLSGGPNVIDENTKKLVFRDGRMIKIDDDPVVEEMLETKDFKPDTKRLGFALYSDPLSKNGAFCIWANYVPLSATSLFSLSDYFVSDYARDILRKQKEHEEFLKRDKELSENPDEADSECAFKIYERERCLEYLDRLSANPWVKDKLLVAAFKWYPFAAQETQIPGKDYPQSHISKIRIDENFRMRGECILFNANKSSEFYFGGFSTSSNMAGHTDFTKKIIKENR
ncbi:MAG: hypothetical protein JW867_02235 [Candidatus Omnitrophica bacterium]|nr:hypothetical protein [Candidatus Omnitrophota bacterium]